MSRCLLRPALARPLVVSACAAVCFRCLRDGPGMPASGRVDEKRLGGSKIAMCARKIRHESVRTLLRHVEIVFERVNVIPRRSRICQAC